MITIQQLKMSGRLPSPRGVALAVIELCNKDEASLPAVVDILKTDPALTGRLVKLANAGIQGSRPIVALQDAVARLGFAMVKQTALGLSLLDGHREGSCPGFDYQAFWSHSLLSAVMMQQCGNRTRIGSAEEMFVLGLLAQIGRLALASVLPDQYGQVLEAHRQAPSRPLAEVEDALLQINHRSVTAALLGDWGIPAALITPVLHHETPETSGVAENTRQGQLTLLLNLALRMADLGSAPESERHRHVPEILLAGGKVGLDAGTMGEIVDAVLRDWRDWGALLHVPASTLPPFDVMSEATAPRPEARGESQPLRVLLVEDDAAQRQLIEKFLAEECGHVVHAAATGREALALALELKPQVVVTDWVMPEMDGLALCRALRETEIGRHLYVLMLTAKDDDDHLEEAYEAGVDAYVTKPLKLRALRAGLRAAWRSVRLKEEWDRDRDQLQRFASELAVANRRLEKAALSDVVTGLPNRRAAMLFLEQAWAATSRSGRPLSLMVIDIDDFKKVNDRYGHGIGDMALREVAVAMRAAARKEESVCRLGGEEFLVICPNTDTGAALQTAERLRAVVAALKVDAGRNCFSVTVSIGVASREPAIANAEQLIHLADEAMYGAKGSGRNRTIVCQPGKLKGSS